MSSARADMRVVIIGAGPAGLYGAYLLKRLQPTAEIRVIEQNPRDATFGFGVVFSDRALDFLATDDPETHAIIAKHLVKWDDLTVVHRDTAVRIDGVGFAAIGRLQLLRLLQDRARSVGIEPEFETVVTRLDELGDTDLIIGADGVNSVVRRALGEDFGARLSYGSNKFVWYGTTKPFDMLTQTFRQTEHGPFTIHHYPYSAEMSTFVVEVDAGTWDRSGFATMDDAACRTRCERVFAAELDDHPLISNNSVWRNFPRVVNARWSAGNAVLVGDALHTAHFSIGSGTRLAMEDVTALVRALGEHPGRIPEALRAYETRRRPIVEALVAAANSSMRWYERMAEHMRLDPHDFAYSYITRSGRMSDERLTQIAPSFMEAYRAHG